MIHNPQGGVSLFIVLIWHIFQVLLWLILTQRLLSLPPLCVCDNVKMSGKAGPDLTLGLPAQHLIIVSSHKGEATDLVTCDTGKSEVRNIGFSLNSLDQTLTLKLIT